MFYLYRGARKAISALYQDELEMSLIISVSLSGCGRYRQSEKLCNMVATWKNSTGYRLKTLMRLSGHKEGSGEVREETQNSVSKASQQ